MPITDKEFLSIISKLEYEIKKKKIYDKKEYNIDSSEPPLSKNKYTIYKSKKKGFLKKIGLQAPKAIIDIYYFGVKGKIMVLKFKIKDKEKSKELVSIINSITKGLGIKVEYN